MLEFLIHLWKTHAPGPPKIKACIVHSRRCGLTSRASQQAQVAGDDWFVLDSIDLRGHLRPAVGLVGDWSYKPLVVYKSNGDAPTTNGTSFKDPGTSFGDIRVSADVRLLGEHGSAFNSAIGFTLYLPTGSRESFTGDGSTRFSPRASVAGDIKVFTYAGRLGLDYRSLTETDSLGTELTIAASAGVHLLEKKQLLLGPEIYGSTVADSFGDKKATPLEWLLGGPPGFPLWSRHGLGPHAWVGCAARRG